MTKAEQTRLGILQKAFGVIYRNGYQATSVDDILADTEVTKGAFFYHFKSKEDMAVRMIKEIMYPAMYDLMVKPFEESENPLKLILDVNTDLLMNTIAFDARYGCPAVNLIEEMAPAKNAFRKVLNSLVDDWRKAMELSLNKGKKAGKVRPDVDVMDVSCFVVSGYSGIRNMGKLLGKGCYIQYLAALRSYLDSLK